LPGSDEVVVEPGWVLVVAPWLVGVDEPVGAEEVDVEELDDVDVDVDPREVVRVVAEPLVVFAEHAARITDTPSATVTPKVRERVPRIDRGLRS
jgi:hypothetical protein